jgi:hypothetical protein
MNQKIPYICGCTLAWLLLALKKDLSWLFKFFRVATLIIIVYAGKGRGLVARHDLNMSDNTAVVICNNVVTVVLIYPDLSGEVFQRCFSTCRR